MRGSSLLAVSRRLSFPTFGRRRRNATARLERDGRGEGKVLGQVAEDFSGCLRGALERVDLREGLLEGGGARGFAGISGVDELLLRGECRLQAALVVAGVEPSVDSECGD